ncbi:unnamed protein product [Ilex paraguariensis]|uniref:Uncharacterized protein n=1 Tax=Ilex paraguariensis TaxID=185542 RepID=A0ABC8TI46_9AQUA
MSGSKLIEAREEVSNDGAIGVKFAVHVAVGEAIGVDELGCSMGIKDIEGASRMGEDAMSEATQDAEGEELWASAGGRADHAEDITVGWARLGEHTTTLSGTGHEAVQVQKEGTSGVRHHKGGR